MKRIAVFFVASVLAGLLAPKATAQGTNLWTTGYPQGGTQLGTIVVQGQVIPDSGWSAASSGTVEVWLVGSGPLICQTISVDANGNWQGTVSGLSHVSYNVVVQVNVTQGAQVATIATDPAQAQAVPPGGGTSPKKATRVRR